MSGGSSSQMGSSLKAITSTHSTDKRMKTENGTEPINLGKRTGYEQFSGNMLAD